jgi:hypothetical protein
MKYALGNMLNGAGGLNPDGLSLDLQFAADKTLTARRGPIPVFIRGSTGTFVGSNGLIQTAAVNAARFDHDPVTLASRGLLIEESRANLVFPSDALTTQTRTVTAVAHTLSFYGTGTVVLSGAHSATVVGTGAYPTRTTLTFTPTAGSLTLTVTGSVTQAQLEAGSFPTSYIPTTTGSVVRSADVCSISGGDFTGIYNAIEGSFLSNSSQPFITVANAQVYAADNGSDAERFNLRHQTSFAVSQLGGVTQSIIDLSDPTANAVSKIAYAYANANYGAARNGTLGASTPNLAVPTVNRIFIGSKGHNSSEYLNGHIASLRYYKKRLPNAKLQALTV